MTENNVNKVPAVAKVFGWISIVLSCLGIVGAVLIVIATSMPSYEGPSVLIQSEDASKIAVFFIGMCLGEMCSFFGGLAGIISLIIMLTKRSRKKLRLPITGIAIGSAAFIATTLATVNLIESVS